MKNNPSAALLLTFAIALPGYKYAFPRDYYNHPEFRTEWWYYTGNLHAANGRPFGFELTFFRQGVDPDSSQDTRPATVWDVRDVWLAHLALSDIDGNRFFHAERLNRAGGGIAGADQAQSRVWNGNWQVRWTGAGERLQAVADRFAFQLTAKPAKPPVVHGDNGVSQKSAGAGHASHYFSETRLNTAGTITLEGQTFQVDGLAWMDHEFFTHQMAANQIGWDWFSLQFDDGSELMLYRLRRKDGSADPYSSGTYVDAKGRAAHLTMRDFALSPGKTLGKIWTSPATHAAYPIQWHVTVPSLQLDVTLGTRLPQQELTGATAYWEGAIQLSGSKQGHPAKGVGYLEMTGYAGPVNFGG